MGKKYNVDAVMGFWVFGFVVGFIAVLLVFIFANEYKDGQIDAMTGKIKYELVTQPDSTRTWEKIK